MEGIRTQNKAVFGAHQTAFSSKAPERQLAEQLVNRINVRRMK